MNWKEMILSIERSKLKLPTVSVLVAETAEELLVALCIGWV